MGHRWPLLSLSHVSWPKFGPLIFQKRNDSSLHYHWFSLWDFFMIFWHILSTAILGKHHRSSPWNLDFECMLIVSLSCYMQWIWHQVSSIKCNENPNWLSIHWILIVHDCMDYMLVWITWLYESLWTWIDDEDPPVSGHCTQVLIWHRNMNK